jgi:hypothetical protein
MHKVEVTEIYSYNMIQNDTRSRDPRCVPDCIIDIFTGTFSLPVGNGYMVHKRRCGMLCWPYSCARAVPNA